MASSWHPHWQGRAVINALIKMRKRGQLKKHLEGAMEASCRNSNLKHLRMHQFFLDGVWETSDQDRHRLRNNASCAVGISRFCSYRVQ